MPAKAIALSRSVGDLLRQQRQRLGYTLRDVERMTSAQGNLIPFSTLARIEQGRLDPGLMRLQGLLSLYGLPIGAAGDLLELEALAGGVTVKGDFDKLRDRGVKAWQSGDLPTAIACHIAMRHRTEEQKADRGVRQEAILTFATFAAKLGKHHIARHMIEELVLDKPKDPLLFRALVQLASTWQALGSPHLALGILGAAENLVELKDLRGRGWVSHLRGSIQIGQGLYDDARDSLREAASAFGKARRPYDRALALVAMARLEVERGDSAAARKAAQAAREFASGKRLARVHALASIQEARAFLLAGDAKRAATILNILGAETFVATDNVIRFYVHFYLARAYADLGDSLRSQAEHAQARHFVRFVDQESPEAVEARRGAKGDGTAA